ncbi:lysylphosphatidylglycerol synthase transmembrane domain-containing protein [Synechococcus elongatus]|nr:lysylphosphatidylglycerol synthase transmembrane domain-containing protein [Synechococcus elongatus]
MTAAKPRASTIPGQRWILPLLLVTALLNLGLMIWGGWQTIWQQFRQIPIAFYPLSLLLMGLSYSLGFWRWHTYLQVLDHWLPVRSSLRIFLGSLALIASPGRAGESIKALWLRQQFGVSAARSLAGLFCERLCDLLAALLLVALGFSARLGTGFWWACLGLAIALFLILSQPQRLQAWAKRFGGRSRRRKGLERLAHLPFSARRLLQPRFLAGGLLISLLTWAIGGVVLYGCFQVLQAEINLPTAIVIRAAVGLGGVLTLLPGGLGGAEAASISLALLYGADRDQAIAATVLLRLLTLWFPIAIGWVALHRQTRTLKSLALSSLPDTDADQSPKSSH